MGFGSFGGRGAADAVYATVVQEGSSIDRLGIYPKPREFLCFSAKSGNAKPKREKGEVRVLSVFPKAATRWMRDSVERVGKKGHGRG